MSPVPEALFMQGLEAVTGACTPFVPAQSGQSLYLRPFLFGTEPGYSVRASGTARFMVIANPSEAYAAGAMKVLVEREQVRAARGGVGFAKTGANYAASLLASTRAVARGFTVALWLDPVERKYVEELSGMNLFAVIGDELVTPVLNDSILPGITRDSLIRLARDGGWQVAERRLRDRRTAGPGRERRVPRAVCLRHRGHRLPDQRRGRRRWPGIPARPVWTCGPGRCASGCWPSRSGARRTPTAGRVKWPRSCAAADSQRRSSARCRRILVPGPIPTYDTSRHTLGRSEHE